MKTSINNLINDYKELIIRRNKLFENKSEEQINKKPTPGSWSAAECVEHLNSYASSYLSNIKVAAKSPDNIERDKIYSPRFLPSKFIKAVGPNAKLKLKSIHVGTLDSCNLDKCIIDQFIGYQEKFLNIPNHISSEDLKRTKVSSPFARILKFQLGEILLLTLYHQQRHLNQAERVINS